MRIGYACLNGSLRDNEKLKRRRIQKSTFISGGLDLISEAAHQNLHLMAHMIAWNEKHQIRFVRITEMLPWMDQYKFEDLPDWDALHEDMIMIGAACRELKHRITVHPSSFCVLASPTQSSIDNSVAELNQNGILFDHFGFEKTPFNKINIHVGGVYNDKVGTMDKFCSNFEKLLNPSTQARLTIENDDRANCYTVEDLYEGVYKKIGIPIVLDLFHHSLNPGNLSEAEAIELACSTWPDDITPVVHMSSSKKDHEDPAANKVAHADYIYRSVPKFPRDVDIMVEAKKTELAVLKVMKEL